MHEDEWFQGRGCDDHSPRPAALAWLIRAVVAAMMVIAPLAMTGCASDRYLTAEQDAKMRELCDRPGGCSIIPGNEWRQIQKLLERIGIPMEEV